MKMLSALGISLCLLGSSAPAQTPLTTVRVASGLNRPLYVTSDPSDVNRLFVVEHFGTVRIVENGVVLPQPFLDVSSNILAGGLRGLLGFTFHPDFASNGYFYINANRKIDGANVITRYTVSSTNPNIADPGSRKILYVIRQPTGNHVAGAIEFGPDGYLYIGSGDGGGTNHIPSCRSQNGLLPHGKILRIDVDSAFPFAIPPDNPFVGNPNYLPEVWVMGLRNPWRFSFDRLTGDAYIGDVGADTYEELNVKPAASPGGENFGWKVMEGPNCFQTTNCPAGTPACNSAALTDPIHVFDHTTGLCSITAGYVYRGCAIPDLQGAYFFADFCSGRMWTLRYGAGAVTDLLERTAELDPGAGLKISSISSFGEDADGELYICDYGGEIFKIVPSTPPCSVSTYGATSPNSTGQPALIGHTGSAARCANDLVLTCTGLPPNQKGQFFFGTTQLTTCVPQWAGYKCVTGNIERLPPVTAGPNGTASLALDLGSPLFAGINPGELRYFQFWYVEAGTGTRNLSNALEVRFCE